MRRSLSLVAVLAIGVITSCLTHDTAGVKSQVQVEEIGGAARTGASPPPVPPNPLP